MSGQWHWRQFECTKCNPPNPRYSVCRWFKRCPDNKPAQTRCRGCNELKTACERGDENGVGVCSFTCECGQTYSVVCRMSDTATCFKCHKVNNPDEMGPRRRINKKTDNKHSCSRCNGSGKCPNMSSHD